MPLDKSGLPSYEDAIAETPVGEQPLPSAPVAQRPPVQAGRAPHSDLIRVAEQERRQQAEARAQADKDCCSCGGSGCGDCCCIYIPTVHMGHSHHHGENHDCGGCGSCSGCKSDGDNGGVLCLGLVALFAACSTLICLGVYGRQVHQSCSTQTKSAATFRTLISLICAAAVWTMLELYGGNGLRNRLLSWIYDDCSLDQIDSSSCDISGSHLFWANVGEQLIWGIVALTMGNLVHLGLNNIECECVKKPLRFGGQKTAPSNGDEETAGLINGGPVRSYGR